jgi:DNA-binding NarL/FixJ family response regulator
LIRVLIVAGYASVRAGLRALLAEADSCQIVGEIGDSVELERVLPETQPDVVLFDGSADEMARLAERLAGTEAGLVALAESRAGYHLLTDSPLRGWAYLLREAEGPEIAGAIQAAAAGLVALDRSLAPLLRADDPEMDTPLPFALSLAADPLTAREHEVLQLMAQGLPNKVIAARLKISLHTAKFHVASILAKLGASSRTEAVTIGARNGYLTL